MTAYTIFESAGGGRTRRVSTVYATAIAGGGTASGGSVANTSYGQSFSSPDYTITQIAMNFDTSGIDDAETVDSVVFSMFVNTTSNTLEAFTGELFAYDFGGTADSTTFRTNVQLAALTKLATCVFPVQPAGEGAYAVFTSLPAFLTAITKTGVTRVLLATEKMRTATAPTTSETAILNLRATAGTDEDPKMVINASVPSGRPRTMSLLGVK